MRSDAPTRVEERWTQTPDEFIRARPEIRNARNTLIRVKGELPSQITPYFYSLFSKYSSFLNEPKKPHQKILIFDEIMSI